MISRELQKAVRKYRKFKITNPESYDTDLDNIGDKDKLIDFNNDNYTSNNDNPNNNNNNNNYNHYNNDYNLQNLQYNQKQNKLNSSLIFTPIRDLYPHFLYTDIAAHPAVVILPYQVV